MLGELLRVARKIFSHYFLHTVGAVTLSDNVTTPTVWFFINYFIYISFTSKKKVLSVLQRSTFAFFIKKSCKMNMPCVYTPFTS